VFHIPKELSFYVLQHALKIQKQCVEHLYDPLYAAFLCQK